MCALPKPTASSTPKHLSVQTSTRLSIPLSIIFELSPDEAHRKMMSYIETRWKSDLCTLLRDDYFTTFGNHGKSNCIRDIESQDVKLSDEHDDWDAFNFAPCQCKSCVARDLSDCASEDERLSILSPNSSFDFLEPQPLRQALLYHIPPRESSLFPIPVGTDDASSTYSSQPDNRSILEGRKSYTNLTALQNVLQAAKARSSVRDTAKSMQSTQPRGLAIPTGESVPSTLSVSPTSTTSTENCPRTPDQTSHVWLGVSSIQSKSGVHLSIIPPSLCAENTVTRRSCDSDLHHVSMLGNPEMWIKTSNPKIVDVSNKSDLPKPSIGGNVGDAPASYRSGIFSRGRKVKVGPKITWSWLKKKLFRRK